MTHEPKHIVITDPRTFDGDPYEAAERAALQAAGLADYLAGAVALARKMARNAEMSRQDERDDHVSPGDFDESAEAGRYDRIETQIEEYAKQLRLLARVASFNPRKAK